MKGFLGANSERGFFSYFDNCIDYQKSGRLFILKGGSGSGKSTLIKKSIQFLQSLGFSLEEYLCSSDTDSYDGAYCEKLNIGIIDGTAPHMVDPRLYGVHDEIINMGDCLDCSELRESQEEIISLVAEKKSVYASVYAYMGAGGKLFHDACEKVDSDIIADRLGGLAYEFFVSLSLERGQMRNPFYRKIFASAFTPTGYTDFTPQYLAAKRSYVLCGAFDNIYSNFLYVLSSYAKMFSERIDYIMHPLCPDMILGLYLRDKDIAVLSDTFIRDNEYLLSGRVDLSACHRSSSVNAIVNANVDECKKMFDCARNLMAIAKEKHEKLELLYRPHMDFEKVNGKIAQVITKIQTV